MLLHQVCFSSYTTPPARVGGCVHSRGLLGAIRSSHVTTHTHVRMHVRACYSYIMDIWGVSLMHPSGHDVTDLFHVVSGPYQDSTLVSKVTYCLYAELHGTEVLESMET